MNLKPCFYCGSTDVAVVDAAWNQFRYIECKDCWATGPVYSMRTVEEASRAWNAIHRTHRDASRLVNIYDEKVGNDYDVIVTVQIDTKSIRLGIKHYPGDDRRDTDFSIQTYLLGPAEHYNWKQVVEKYGHRQARRMAADQVMAALVRGAGGE